MTTSDEHDRRAGPAVSAPGRGRGAPEGPDGSALAIALATRDLIGGAKRQLMASRGIDAHDAFELLRQYSRASRMPIRDVALQLVRHEWVPVEPA